MMSPVSDRCICLRKLEYSETSQILTLLSRQRGMVRVMAKGAHRRTKAGASRFDGGIDLLDIGHAVFSGDADRELALLTDWKLEEGHLELRRSLRALYLAIYAVEMVSLLFEEHDPHPEVFDRTETILAELGTGRREAAFIAFELDVLREAGFSPEIRVCVNCGASAADRDGIFFAASRGGVVCRNCQASFPERMTLDVRLLRLLQLIQSPPDPGAARRLPLLSRHQTDPLNLLLARHVEHALGRRMRAAEYILAKSGVGARGSASAAGSASGGESGKIAAGQFACNSSGHGA